MTLARQKRGLLGEELAVRALERRGYAILARRYRTRHGEIDLIADDRGTLVFVEVKARTDGAFGTGADAVTWRKRRRLVRMASLYLLATSAVHRPSRFDVVAVSLGPPEPAVEVFVNAFDAC